MTLGQTQYRKKLIEVALPLEAINVQSAREKSIRHGHPSTLHLWWARRPLAACRAVLFSSIVDDPSSLPEQFPTEEAQDVERGRLFRIIEELVKWENSTNEDVLHQARTEIARSVARTHDIELPATLTPAQVMDALREYAPPVLDPFCGGGSIPLEAQRLGLEAHGSDLNPVAVLITKALIEIPPKFAGKPPVNPNDRSRGAGAAWKGAAGLAADVRYYGKWMRDEAEKRIGHLYPKVTLPPEHGRGEATVIAWLWARTVTCPNPACGAQMPLVRSFALSTKKGKEAWVEPVIDRAAKSVRFDVKTGSGNPLKGTVERKGATCVVCRSSVGFDHIRSEGRADRMGAQLMAIVAEGKRGRVYVEPNSEHEVVANSAIPSWMPESDLPEQALGFRVQLYGMTRHSDLFTSRQLVALTTFSDLVGEARERVHEGAIAASLPNDDTPLHAGGTGAPAYADAVATYLAFALDKMTTTNSAICTWQTQPTRLVAAFSRQAIPMVWDYAEANPLSGAAGDYTLGIGSLTKVIENLVAACQGTVNQYDARAYTPQRAGSVLVSTDPPYYDNIGYSDLSDYFYVWLRPTIGTRYPDLFGTLLTPKSNELIATPFRFEGNRKQAEQFFEQGLSEAFDAMHSIQEHAYPMSLFYAFKQAENVAGGNGSLSVADALVSTGWETMLQGLMKSGFSVTGTWPVRTELIAALKKDVGALASSIVLVCRPRPTDAPSITRGEFIRALRSELAPALRTLQHGNIAPVDLAQAAIGPGMAIFSRYSKVLEPNGNSMRVRSALQLINQELDHVLTEQEAEYGPDTRWAVSWFEQFGMTEGEYGNAEVLARARDVSITGLDQAGIVVQGRGKVRLKRRDEMNPEWDPALDTRVTVWEMTQHLIRRRDNEGEPSAADLLARLGGQGEAARDLAYRLYTICERKGWAQEAIAYNSLVIAWPEIQRLSSSVAQAAPRQQRIEM